MRISVLLIMLMPGLACASGSLVAQPQADGGIKFFHEGPTGGGGNDVLTFTQQAGKTATLQLTPAGNASCEGGDLAMDPLRLTLKRVDNHRQLSCGEPVVLPGEDSQRKMVLRVENQPIRQNMASLLRNNQLPRVQIGQVTFNQEGGENVLYPLYLDMSLLQQTAPTLSAVFEPKVLNLGGVGEQHDVSKTVNLRVSKTSLAETGSIAYDLTFESTQQRNNLYHLRSSAPSSSGETLLPYQIIINRQQIVPGVAVKRQVPAGTAASDVVEVTFSLPGKATRGMPAGVHLLDTLTAVITPQS